MTLRVLPTIDRLPEPLRRFMDRLSEEHKLLLALKRDLYEGDWRAMITDLRNRLEGRPYIVRLAGRIEDDLKRIEQMMELERHYSVNLDDHLSGLDEAEQEP